MKIAVTYDNEQIFQHFGHTEQFKIYDIKNDEIVSKTVVSTNGQGHGALSIFLKENNVDVLICGGIGGGAISALNELGIKLFGGVSGDCDKAVEAFLKNELNYNPNVRCSHHDHEHGNGAHTCGEHGCGKESCHQQLKQIKTPLSKGKMKIVIVGGVAGGATAAARIRRLNEHAEIIIFERSGFISYANCGLPYYIGGVIEDKEDLILQTPESFFRRFRIIVKVNHEVTDIDVQNKTVHVTDLKAGTSFTETYDKLILSPGAKPILPDFYTENERTFTLRTVEDTLKIRAFVEQKQPKTAVIIGGGFIGLEMAENLAELGIKTTILQRSDHLLPTVDCDMASFVHSKMRHHGVQLLLNTNINKMSITGEKVSLYLDKGSNISADMVVLAVGVTPENTLAKKIGLELGVKGAIKVNAKMKTSIPDIYAVGDAVQVKHFITDKDSVISLAGPANKQGRIVADNICGLNSEYKGTQGSSVIKLFDMTVATTGINEQQAKANGIEYEKVILTQNSHAGYYPRATAMTVKLIFEKATYKILGAQIVGYDGVDKRIDVIATAIRAGMKADELKDLDLTYAPPYSSAKDPVNMAGFVAENIKNGIVKQFYYEDISSLRERKDVILLDTRTPFEYMRGHAEDFINIPLDDLRERLGELDKTKQIYVMCQSGLRSYLATRILMQNGFDAYNFAGGFRLYSTIKNEEMLSKQCYTCGMDK